MLNLSANDPDQIVFQDWTNGSYRYIALKCNERLGALIRCAARDQKLLQIVVLKLINLRGFVKVLRYGHPFCIVNYKSPDVIQRADRQHRLLSADEVIVEKGFDYGPYRRAVGAINAEKQREAWTKLFLLDKQRWNLKKVELKAELRDVVTKTTSPRTRNVNGMYTTIYAEGTRCSLFRLYTVNQLPASMPQDGKDHLTAHARERIPPVIAAIASLSDDNYGWLKREMRADVIECGEYDNWCDSVFVPYMLIPGSKKYLGDIWRDASAHISVTDNALVRQAIAEMTDHVTSLLPVTLDGDEPLFAKPIFA